MTIFTWKLLFQGIKPDLVFNGAYLKLIYHLNSFRANNYWVFFDSVFFELDWGSLKHINECFCCFLWPRLTLEYLNLLPLIETIHLWRPHGSGGESWNLPRVCGFSYFQTMDLLFIFMDGGGWEAKNWSFFVNIVIKWRLVKGF